MRRKDWPFMWVVYMELRYLAGISHCMIGREHNSAFMSRLVGGAINWAADF